MNLKLNYVHYKRSHSLNRALQYLLDGYPLFTSTQIITYINSIYNMYINNRILYAYPIAIRPRHGPCVALNNILSIV